MKAAFIYPGQGAQKTGMGQDFYEKSPLSRKCFDKSSEILGFDMKKLCFEENELLNRTDYTQAALVTTCLAMTKEVLKRGIKPAMTAGLSLGEYCALVTAGCMSYEDAIRTIWIRGNLMNQADPNSKGGMSAVLGLSGDQVMKVVSDIEGASVANFNCPGQLVITGEKDALKTAGLVLKEAGAKRVIPLKVSGPFHSPYMREAGEKLYESLSEVPFRKPEIPYVANVDGEIKTDVANVRELLRDQVSSSVRWEQSVRAMIDAGVDTYVEIGPGKTLSGFMRRIDRGVKSLHISTWEDLEKVVEELAE